jgi:glycosyltransferase involved in cell wall biosynthesis
VNRNNLKISVVFSFYNEERIIPELLIRMRKIFSDLIKQDIVREYELIFVNDASTDGSEKLLKKEIEYGDILLLNMSRNFGVSECVIAGMQFATGDAVIYMDADLQDPPEVIPKLIDAWRLDYETEIVYTTRTNRRGEHWLKVGITKLGYRLINAISDVDLPVDSGDFKLLSRRAVNELLKLNENQPYLRGLVSWIGFKQTQVLYEREARFDGRENTKMNVLSRKVIYYWLDRALISFSDAPLKIILFLGITVSFISLFYIFVVVAQKLLGFSVPGWAALMSAILLLGGVQLITIGGLGLYVSAIFRGSKNRPNYIIKDIYKNLSNTKIDVNTL